MKVYIGDTGTEVRLDCEQDVSAATQRSIEVRKPGGATVSWAAQASGSNFIQYTSLVGTFDIPGEWVLQAKVELPTGVWLGESVSLHVYRKFK
jgi:hypothetical protein